MNLMLCYSIFGKMGMKNVRIKILSIQANSTEKGKQLCENSSI
jgi:hypothetical protein